MEDLNHTSMLSESSRDRRLVSPRHIKDYVRVTPVSITIIVVTCLMMLLALTVWAFLGNVTDKAYYSGIVFPARGTTDVYLPCSGCVHRMLVQKGDKVSKGQAVAIVSIADTYSVLPASQDGMVINTLMPGEEFAAIEPIVSLVDNADLAMVAYTTDAFRRAIRPGMKAQMWPVGESRDQIGYFTGTVMSVGHYPVSMSDVKQRFRNEDLVRSVLPESGAVYEIYVVLDKDPEGELCWSFGQPDDVDISAGTHCEVMSETRKRSIVQYLFEKIRTGEHKVGQWVE